MDKQRAIANALTAIDGRFLEEAEIYAAPRKRNLLRPMLSAAACLLLVAGLTFLWPRPLKLQVNGENVWKGAVSISQEAEPMALLAVRTVSVPFTLDPGRGGTVTVEQLQPVLSRADIFGLDLNKAGLAPIITADLNEMLAGKGAVRAALKKLLA